MKKIVSIPLSKIDRLEIKVTGCRKTIAQVKAETGAAYILNGGMWNADGSPCPLLKVNGKTLSKVPWSAYGYGWDVGPDIHMTALIDNQNFISVTPLIQGGVPIQKLSYAYDQGGKRGRSAMGLKAGALCFYCSSDGSSDAKTPEQLRDELHTLGWESAIMLDGGGSSQCWFDGQVIPGDGRKCHNYIVVYVENKKEDKPVDEITSAIMTGSACYKAGKTITPRGIMVHSTAAPGVMADSLRNTWNNANADAAVHAIIDDTQTLQTLPWACRGWHAGTGSGGKSANDTHISFEICEPEECRLLPEEWVALRRGGNNPAWAVRRLQMELQARGYDPKGVDGSFGPGCEVAVKAYQSDAGLTVDGSCGPATRAALAKRSGSYLAYDAQDVEGYFQTVWTRAVALCAKLCRDYGLDPATDILCHAEGCRAGIASNHADVEHWFPQHGKSMDDFRKDVKEKMEGKTTSVDTNTPDTWAAAAWKKANGTIGSDGKPILDGTRPRDTITRQEVAVILDRLGLLDD